MASNSLTIVDESRDRIAEGPSEIIVAACLAFVDLRGDPLESRNCFLARRGDRGRYLRDSASGAKRGRNDNER